MNKMLFRILSGVLGVLFVLYGMIVFSPFGEGLGMLGGFTGLALGGILLYCSITGKKRLFR
ncbi:hypothetical protein [Microbulbifer spongiae]|uniref:DUF2892 domain-containing protein n=1 Tax=Microbulbifer spongiae TaxID=2944933 RepID=A0ABY9EGN9_9GAMM|nr:hypothetical protein [Microbulbifer sp. MI-G]WKD50585.1 hypothetical protein M8T91_03930 [Microbulbifer sp. MI-G]